MKKCPHCKKEIEENSTFCEYCGHQIKRSKKPLWITLGAIVAVAVIVVLTINLAGRSPKIETMHFSESKKYYTFIEGLIKDAGNCDQLENAADELESRIWDDVLDQDEMTQIENEKLKKIAEDLTQEVKKKAKKMGCDEDIIDDSDLKEWGKTDSADSNREDSINSDRNLNDTVSVKGFSSNWKSEYQQKYDSIKKATEQKYDSIKKATEEVYQKAEEQYQKKVDSILKQPEKGNGVKEGDKPKVANDKQPEPKRATSPKSPMTSSPKKVLKPKRGR